MSVEASQGEPTVVQRVVLALASVPGERGAFPERLALMYAEAIDDADEADALLRFGPKLATCLASLGVSFPVGTRPQDRAIWLGPRLAA